MVNKTESLSVEGLIARIGREAARRLIGDEPVSVSLAVALGTFETLQRLVEPDLEAHRRDIRIERLPDFQRLVLEILTEMQVGSGGTKKYANGQILARVNLRGEKASRYRVVDALNALAEEGFVYLSGKGRAAVWSVEDQVIARLVEQKASARPMVKTAAA